ncbi:discoidin domain-containing protein [Acinetobacter sp. MYb177]|uniref:discoidin domain-containing protein n=1 Tax=unclassified Acinetobacter TaxID=196816 RepID=UPI0030B4CCFE
MSSLKSTWDLEGAPAEQRYYCSLDPIDTSNPPTPKEILSGSVREHIDYNIVKGENYYVRISSVFGATEKFSEEFYIQTIPAFTKFQYVRIYITSNNGDSLFTAIQEIEIASTVGGVDITTPSTPAFASSSYSGEFGPSELFDNDFTGQSSGLWFTPQGAQPPHWVYVNLVVQVDIAEVRMWPMAQVGGLPRSPKHFIIQGSNDGSIWTDIKSFTDITDWAVGVPKKFSLS